MLPPPAATNPKTPIAFARSTGSVKRLIISDNDTAETIAPPRPCTARAPTRSCLRGREPTGERGDGEQRDPDQEQPPVPVEIAEPPAEQEEAAEGEQVGVDDPSERGLGESEVGPDRWQRDVHDRRVEDDHQRASTQHEEREPSSAGVHEHRLILSANLWEHGSPEIRPARRAELIGRSVEAFSVAHQSHR